MVRADNSASPLLSVRGTETSNIQAGDAPTVSTSRPYIPKRSSPDKDSKTVWISSGPACGRSVNTIGRFALIGEATASGLFIRLVPTGLGVAICEASEVPTTSSQLLYRREVIGLSPVNGLTRSWNHTISLYTLLERFRPFAELLTYCGSTFLEVPVPLRPILFFDRNQGSYWRSNDGATGRRSVLLIRVV